MSEKNVMGIDIGCYNLAICVMNCDTETILDWRVVSIFEDEPVCSGYKKNGGVCGKRAKFQYKNEYRCGVHKMEGGRVYKAKTFKEYTIHALMEKCLRKLKELVWNDVDTIVIEKQPPCNPKMKMMSHAIHSFFILDAIENAREIPKVIYAHAKNKLKCIPMNIRSNKKGAYQQRKDRAIMYTREYIKDMEAWKGVFEMVSKKDDLSDSLLYCLWFIKKMGR